MTSVLFAALTSLIVLLAFAAPPACVAPGQEFETLSVKPAQSGLANVAFHSDAVRLNATNNSLRLLIQRAYGVEDYQIAGPDWLGSQRFDVMATFTGFASGPENYAAGIQAMMQKMLADRFQLIVHRDKRRLSGTNCRRRNPALSSTRPLRARSIPSSAVPASRDRR